MRPRIRTNFAKYQQLPSLEDLQLPLSRAQVLSAERRWAEDRRALWESQWQTIQTFAAELWNTPETSVAELQRRWIMLTYAVGNFKRQGNTAIQPLPAPWRLAPLSGDAERRPKLSIPTCGEPIELSSSGTTASLWNLAPGLASPPTGSALLAALWPSEHAILDRRDFQVTVGLLAGTGSPVVAVGEQANLQPPNWEEYLWFRALIKAETGRLELPNLVTLERALYAAYGLIPANVAVSHLSWQEWGCELLQRWP